MVEIDARLGGQALDLMNTLLQGTDGLTDAGHYGATWKEGPPDVVAFLGHVGCGYVTLNGYRDEGTAWLQGRFSLDAQDFMAADGPEVYSRFLVIPLVNHWLMATLPVWAQIVRDAAADGKLIVASRDHKEVSALMNQGLALDRAEHAQEHPSGIVDRTIGGRLARINLHDLEENPGIIGEVTRQVVEELTHEHEAGLHPPDPADELHRRLEKVDLDNHPLLTAADAVQDQIEEGVLAHLDTTDGYYGAVPNDPAEVALLAPSRCHVHARVELENGLVYVHPTGTDNYLGGAFIQHTLCLPHGEQAPLAHPIGMVLAPGIVQGTNVVGVSVTVWPQALAFAELLGILVYQGECPDDDGQDDDEAAPEPTPEPQDAVPV